MKKAARPVILSASYGIWGGGQIFIQSLAEYMCESCDSPAVIATAEPDAFTGATVRIPRIDQRSLRLKRSVHLARLLQSLGFNRILLNDLAPLWLAPIFRAAGFSVSALLHLHLQPRTGDGVGHTKLEQSVLKATALACDSVFSVNRQNVETFGSRVRFVGNYAPDRFFRKPIASFGAEKVYDVIFVARLAPQKDPETFVALVACLHRHQQGNFRALMVGSGPLNDRVDVAIRRCGLESVIDRIAWVDRQALPELLDRSKCFVMTSLYEGFATTVIEAHARGLPVVTTETSGFCPEFVRNFGGCTGIVFDATTYNPTNLSGQISQLIRDAQELAPLCRRKASLFTKESVLLPIRDWLVGET